MKLRSVSIQQLSEKCSLGTATLSNILNGRANPSTATVQKIADSLDVSINDLFCDIPKLKTLRYRTNKTCTAREKAEQDQLKIDIAYWLKDYLFLEKITGQKNNYIFKNFVEKKPIEAAHKTRELLNIQPTQPIWDIVQILEDAGIKIYIHPFSFKQTFGMSLGAADNGPAIIINDNRNISFERKIYTIAHELGHLLLHGNSYNDKFECESKEEEKQADEFAAEFLMPMEAFKEKWQEYKGLNWVEAVLQIKQYFGVSYRTVLYRLTKITNDNELYKVFSFQYKKSFGHDLKDHFEPDPLTSLRFIPTENEYLNKLSGDFFINRRFNSLARTAYQNNKIPLEKAAQLFNVSTREMKKLRDAWL
jgi:Zn-dependent peptidase ImmA (M78 family)/DNA-binding XRE family transcriptional regulator